MRRDPTAAVSKHLRLQLRIQVPPVRVTGTAWWRMSMDLTTVAKLQQEFHGNFNGTFTPAVQPRRNVTM